MCVGNVGEGTKMSNGPMALRPALERRGVFLRFKKKCNVRFLKYILQQMRREQSLIPILFN